MKPGTDSYGIWVSYALTMDRYVQAARSKHMALVETGSAPQLSPRVVAYCGYGRRCTSKLQYRLAAELPSFPVAIGQASA